LAWDNKSWSYKAELPHLVYTPRISFRVLSYTVFVFFVTAMHV